MQAGKKVGDMRNLGKSQRRARHVKKVSDGCKLKKKSATDCCDLEKTQRRGRPGKSQRCAHIDKEVSDGFVRAGKKNQRRTRSRRKFSDMRNLGHNQRQARPVKKFRDGRNLKKNSARDSCELAKKVDDRYYLKKKAMGAIWKRNQRRPCASWQKKISDRLDRWKESATSAPWKRSQRQPWASWQKKSTTGTTWKKKRWVQSEKEVSNGLVRAGKKKISDRLDLWKESATSATWKRSQRRA